MLRRSAMRLAAGSAAALTTIALGVGPAAAAAGQGPDTFDSAAAGKALTITVGLPQALADGLAPVLSSLEGLGITLDGADLNISLSTTLAELELPLVDGVAGDVLSVAGADSVTGSIQGLVESLVGTVTCLDSPLEVSIPADASVPLVAFDLLSAECTKDADGRLSIASSRIADLEVNLAGALEMIETIPGGAEISQGLTDTFDAVTGVVEEQVFPGISPILSEVTGVVSEVVGTEIDLTEALRVPRVFDIPLVKIDLIESVSTTVTEGDMIRSVASTKIAGGQLLGTVCLTDATYKSEAFATGEAGGNDYLTEIPAIGLGICDTSTLLPILSLIEHEGVLNDVFLNLGSGQLKSLEDVLTDTGIPLEDLLGGLEDLLATLGVSTIVQGRAVDGVRSEDGKTAGVTVEPFRISVAPLAGFVEGTPLENTRVEISGLGNSVRVQAAGIAKPGVPAGAPDPDPKLPKTGGGALAAVMGALALGGAATLRKRG